VLSALLYVGGVWLSTRLTGDVRPILGFSRDIDGKSTNSSQPIDIATDAGV
jgi:hypothetical protein